MGDNIDSNRVLVADLAAILQQMQQQMEELRAQQAQQQQQQHRAIGEMDTPHTYYQNRAAICPPEPARHDFEIKPQMIALVKQHLFHGLPAENPMEHIENFEEICSTSKPNGVPPGYLKCKLFRHSLADKADRWLKSLPPRSLTTWPEVRACFLDHFFTKSKTASLRNKITTFEQYSGESFCETWERFNEYRRDCPHHGFSEEQLLSIFYDGVSWDYKTALNSASNGNFMTQSIDGAHKLLENMAASSSSGSAEYNRSKRVVHQCDDEADLGCSQRDMDTKEVSYAQRQGYVQNRDFNQNYCNHPILSYRSSNVENPQFQVYPPQQQPSTPATDSQAELKGMMQQLLVSQKHISDEITAKFNSMYSEFNGKLEAVFTHLKVLDTQVAQTAEVVKMQQGVLLAKSDKNPRNGAGPSGSCEHVNFIGSGEKELKLMMQEIIDGQTRSAEGQTRSAEGLKHNISTLEWKVDCLSKDLQREVMKTFTTGRTRSVDLPPSPDRSSCLAKRSIDRPPAIDRSTPCNPVREKSSKRSIDPPTPIDRSSPLDARSIDPPPLIDRSATNQPSSTSSSGTSSQTPILTKQVPKAPFSGQTPAPTLRQLPKLGDPGRFLVPCSINGVVFEDALCDSGSTVNVMSTAIAQRLGIDNIHPSTRPLRFGDGNISTTQGSVKDLQVRIEDCLIPCDFQVVEMSNNTEMALILGRPFLNTAGALVDLPQKRVSLARVNKGVFYVAVKVDKWLEHDSCDVIEEMTKPKSGGAPLQPHVTLTPQRRVGDAIEYKVKCKGMSKSFSKVKALITPELKAQGQAAVDVMMNRILKLDFKPPPPPPPPDPPADHSSHA